jgi:hypothetical protein
MDINLLIPKLALYVSIVSAIAVIGIAVTGAIAAWKGTGESFGTILQRANIVQMLTIVTIIIAACTLRVVDKIDSEAVVSILSGIAGYVLGGTGRSQNPPPPTAPSAKPSHSAI